MFMSKAIVFSGLICSGKTTLADHYCAQYQWDKISFGSYIKNIAEKRQVSLSRHNLQQIGYEIFKNTDPHDFLRQVINFNKPVSHIHIYDSIRHLDILSEVREYYEDTVVFYLNVDENIIYKRYIDKYNVDISYSEFKKIIEHPIEKGIVQMIDFSDYILDSSKATVEVIDEVDVILEKHGFL